MIHNSLIRPRRRINFDNYDSIEVSISGPDAKKCKISSFAEAGLYDQTREALKLAGYIKPTPIQRYAIPLINEGRDIMGCAQSGSGKTAAYLLPIITGILKDNLMSPTYEPAAVILVPTLEIATEIYNEAKILITGTIIRAAVCKKKEIDRGQPKGGADIIVASPDCLIKFVERKKVGLRKLKYLVLDEPSRMICHGLKMSIDRLVRTMGMTSSDERQTMMFSDEFPEYFQRYAIEYLKPYLFVNVSCVSVEENGVNSPGHWD